MEVILLFSLNDQAGYREKTLKQTKKNLTQDSNSAS